MRPGIPLYHKWLRGTSPPRIHFLHPMSGAKFRIPTYLPPFFIDVAPSSHIFLIRAPEIPGNGFLGAQQYGQVKEKEVQVAIFANANGYLK